MTRQEAEEWAKTGFDKLNATLAEVGATDIKTFVTDDEEDASKPVVGSSCMFRGEKYQWSAVVDNVSADLLNKQVATIENIARNEWKALRPILRSIPPDADGSSST